MTAAARPSRRERIWALHDFSTGRGLEIGPLGRALVPRDLADVRYVDVTDRAGLLAHYADDPGVDPDQVPEIDYPLIQPDGRTRSLAEASADGAPFAWAVASHVIEHVPDVVGWLADLAEVTEDGAALVLAVPDRRYCFDALRPPTTVGQMVEAHLAGHTRPSPRAVYDYFAGVVEYDRRDLWRGVVPRHEQRLYSPAVVEAKLTESLETYVDAHVWLFTPQSLVEQLHELRLGGRCAWYVERLEPTRPDDNEFLVLLRRVARGAAPDAVPVGALLPEHPSPDWLVPPDVSDLVPALAARVTVLEQRLKARRRRLEDRDREIAALRSQLATLRDRSPRGLARRAARGVRGLSRRRPGRR